MNAETPIDYGQLGRRDARKALVSAVEAEDLERVRHIIEKRPDIVDARNSHGHTPLSEAVPTGNLDIVRALVEAGADPMQRNHGGSSLIDAAAHVGCVEVARFLQSNGCVVTRYHAAALGDVDAIRQELDSDDNIAGLRGPRGTTMLHHAAHGNHSELCSLLIAAGAPVDPRDGHRHTPLCYAVERNALEAAEVLIESGADVNHHAGHFGGTVLHRAILNRFVEMSLLLITSGADPNMQDFSGKSALHSAVASGKAQIVEALLNTAVDLDLRTRKTKQQPGNETALEYAQRLKKKRIAQILEAHLTETSSRRLP